MKLSKCRLCTIVANGSAYDLRCLPWEPMVWSGNLRGENEPFLIGAQVLCWLVAFDVVSSIAQL
jgi:hypothetical protein